MNLIDFFDAGARQHPDAPCFQLPACEASTYADVRDATCRVVRGLKARGIETGFHGAVLSANDPAAFVAVLSIARAGGVWLPVNARNATATNVEFLRDMDCDVLFYQHRWAEQVAEIRRRLPRIRLYVCLDGPADVPLAELMAGASADFLSRPWNPEATAVILSTGGTTGRSKGVMLTNRNIAAMCANLMSAFDITARMTYLAAAPITHTAGLLALPFIARGARVILMDGIDPQRLLAAIQEEGVNMLFLPPTAIYSLLAQDNVAAFDFSSLRYIFYGAAPMSPDKLAQAIDVFGATMIQGYGQSEAPGTISVLLREEHFIDGETAPRERLKSAGRPFPFTRVAIMTDAGDILSQPGERGEIVVQGDVVMRGYYRDPTATAEATLNGWHRTGDVGYFDADGFLYIVDRKKDMIITGGFNVYSAEVEAALMAHPAVRDCAVIGVPDEKWGEAVKAVVEVAEPASIEALIDFVKQQLGSVKTPKSIDIVDELPRSSVGKVLKKEVRALYWANTDRLV